MWFETSCIKCGILNKITCSPAFRERTLKSGWICQLPLAKATPQKRRSFLSCVCWPRVPNDLSATVLSCWGPAKHTLWLRGSHIKHEIPNQDSCLRAIALLPPINGKSGWTLLFTVSRKYTTKTHSSHACWITEVNGHTDGRPSEQTICFGISSRIKSAIPNQNPARRL